MSSRQVCLYKDKGHVIAEEIFKPLAENCAGYSISMVLDNTLFVDRKVLEKADVIDTAALAAACEEYKQLPMLFNFVKFSNALLIEDIQPIPVITHDDIVHAVMILEGDLTQFSKPGTPYSDAYFAIEGRFRPKLLKVFKSNDSDIGKTSLDLADEDTTNEVAALLPENCSAAILDSTGHFWSCSNPDGREKEFPWGSAFGMGEYPDMTVKKDEPAPTPKPNKNPLAGMILAKKPTPTGTVANPPPGTDTSALNTAKAPVVLAKKKDSEEFIEASGLMETPPPEIDNKTKLDEWYTRKIGYRPSNWKERPAIPATQRSSIPLNSTKDTTKYTSSKHIPTFPMLLSASQRDSLSGTVMPRILGANSELIMDPSKIVANESTIPSAASQLGRTGVMDFAWPERERYQICAEYPEFAQRIWGDFIALTNTQINRIKELEGKIKGLEDKTDKVEDKKTDHVIAHEELKPTGTTSSLPSGMRIAVKRR